MIPFAMAALALLGFAAQTTVTIPRSSTPVVIDGKADVAEWSNAVRGASSPSGLQVRLQHDGTALYIAVEAPADGFTSLCLGTSDRVQVLHASAALGAVDYRRTGGPWAPDQALFVYGMRDPSMTEAAISQRQAYFTQNGWVASTASMGGHRVQEFKIDMTRIATRLAIAFYSTTGTGSVLTWPDSVSANDGCASLPLVRGTVTGGLTFDPSRWAPISLGPAK
ncbi:MAG TPA: hypothetical protein VFZ31_17095 [Vicinamibacterales bacterium]